jgi:hypothetical protein
VLLTFVGVKMLLHDVFPIPTSTSLIAIASILAVSVLASNLRNLIIKRRVGDR